MRTDGFLDFDPPATPLEPVDPIEQAALRFHAANPQIFDEIVAVARRAQSRGLRRWSVNAAFEVVRYNAAMTTTGQTYKLNNSYRSHYARWIMRDVPALAGFFVTRDAGRIEQDYDADE